MSVEDLAKNAGVEAKLVSRAEEGEVYPPLGILVKLSRALGQRLRCGRTRSSPIIRTG
jgi:transcriptional regulator with XRE-family HTH domain